ARSDPRDVDGIRASIEEPADRVRGGLAAADDDVPGGRLLQLRQLADGDAAGTLGNLERGGIRRRHTRRHGGCVDDTGSNRHLAHLAGDERTEPPVAEEVAHREEPDAPRWKEPVPHDLVVVATDLGAA